MNIFRELADFRQFDVNLDTCKSKGGGKWAGNYSLEVMHTIENIGFSVAALETIC